MASLSRILTREFSTSRPLSTLAIERLNRFNPISTRVRFFSTDVDKTFCQCGAQLPETERIIELFRARKLRSITSELDCRYFDSFQFVEANDCELVEVIEEIATPLLKSFPDVTRVGDTRLIFLESLKAVPEGDLGDLTGDHGKQIEKFLRDCLDKKLLPSIGAVFDIGGQNTSTVNLIASLMGNPQMPCMIVDINSITPAISLEQPNITYIIEDALTFFSSPSYQESITELMGEKPTIFIFNNMLNVLKAEDGWKTLESAWEKLRRGDFLVISGLVPEQLEKHGFKRYHEVDGIIEFHNKTKGFYKSALSSEFFEYVKTRLKNSSILVEETFRFSIETRPSNTMEVKGRRMLTLKKTHNKDT